MSFQQFSYLFLSFFLVILHVYMDLFSRTLNREILPALQYTIEWIYQFVLFESEEHFLFRQCASSLIGLISVRNSMNFFFDRLPVCMSKWFSIASRGINLEVSCFAFAFINEFIQIFSLIGFA